MVKRLRNLLLAAPLVVLASASSRAARADDSSVAAATVLFDEAVRLMEAGRFVEACSKLARSQTLAPNGGTLLALAECNQRSGKIASAWLAYREAATRAASAGKREAEVSALEHAKSLEPRLPRLVVSLTDPGQTPGIEIRRDGVLLKDAELGVAVPVDPGAHEIVATAPERRKWLHTVATAEGATVNVAIPRLETDDGTTPFKPREEAASTWHAQKTVGLLVAGVGLAGVVVGGVFGAKASSTNDDALRSCPVKEPTVQCTPEGLALTDDAQSQALLSTVFVIVGAAALVGGGVLFFTAPSGKTQSERAAGARFGWTPVVGHDRAGAAATLRW